MTLEQIIKQRLEEATKQVETVVTEAAKIELKEPAKAAEEDKEDEVVVKPKLKKADPVVKEESETTEVKPTVSSQVSALLEAEGLSDEFKIQAVTIFEAAVADRVLQIEEGLKTEFETQLAEAKEELNKDIDGFLSEAVQQWRQENEVAIKANFNTQVAESFMDGMRALIAEHNIDVPEGKEDALEVALSEVTKLSEEIEGSAAAMQALQEEMNTLKAKQILESFKSKMTQTEFDRFSVLTESVKFENEGQYEKQLTIVLENFGNKSVIKEAAKPVVSEVISEEVSNAITVVTESNSVVNKYAAFIAKNPR
jgi:hypothetical protein